MSQLDTLFDQTTGIVSDPKGWEYRVRVLTVSQALRAGAGLPGFARLRGMMVEAATAGGPLSDAIRDEKMAIMRAQAQNTDVMLDMADYQEKIAMAAVSGIRFPGGEWQDVRLVPPDAQDKDRGYLSVAVVSGECLNEIVAVAQKRGQQAADEVARFPGEE